jgi:DNA-binding MarR family transcriptional regulator
VTTEPLEGVGSPRRPATEVEARAMASAIRLRILRLCLDGALTNKEIAARLDKDPASVLYHVRRLVDSGFLVPEPVRRGTRGARERPYRATGKSWILEVVDTGARSVHSAAMFEAFVAEVQAAGLEQAEMARLGLRLTAAERADLHRRLSELFDEYARREPAPDGEPWALFYVAHPDPRPVSGPRWHGEPPRSDRWHGETAVPATTSHDTIEDDD